MRTTVLLGADEGFELAKATLCARGFHLYTQVWNDQPPLLTFLVTQILERLTTSALGPRLLTGFFSALLLSSLFLLALRLNGLLAAVLATAFLIASPGFLILGSSCMLEIPALATAVAALAVLAWANPSSLPWAEALAGTLFGISLETKLITAVLLPLVAVLIWSSPRNLLKSGAIIVAAMLVSIMVVDWTASGGAYLAHWRTVWASHFAPVRSSGHGSPADHPFDWTALVKNWDTVLPALAGVLFCVRLRPISSLGVLPPLWLGLVLAVFAIHRPWWHYYIVHSSIPLCWCAAIGLASLLAAAWSRGRRFAAGALLVYLTAAAAWMGARLYFQIGEARRSPQTFSSLFLNVIQRYKPRVQSIYCEEPVYSFHAGIPMPPDLAVVMLKRFWSGEISDERIAADLQQNPPGLILLRNDSAPRSFRSLINSSYRLIYEDGAHLLYVRQDLSMAPPSG